MCRSAKTLQILTYAIVTCITQLLSIFKLLIFYIVAEYNQIFEKLSKLINLFDAMLDRV